jgi:hypothetical protein
MRKLKTGLNWAKLEAFLGSLVVIGLAVVPAVENADWRSTAGCVSGAFGVAAIVGVRLLGHQRWDRLVAEYGPVAATAAIQAGKILKDGIPIQEAPKQPVETAQVGEREDSSVPSGPRVELDQQLGFAEYDDAAALPVDAPLDDDKGDSRSKAAKKAGR